jgi:hypothetical protein
MKGGTPIFATTAILCSFLAARTASRLPTASLKGTATGFVWVLYDCIASTPSNPVLRQTNLSLFQPYIPDGTQNTECPGGTQKYCAVKYQYNTSPNSTSQLIYNESTDEVIFNSGYPGGRTAAKNVITNGIVYCQQ